ncbi:MAG: hypothetical protein QG580_382 [Patescibacteria group bacterium]|jgi:energy-coupling factor transporter ATP-binding protein EcfA2|nr:hypothetical protein [Patescibacteria group bacterium]
MFEPDRITYFGETDFRGKKTRFGIKAEDRSRHVYVIGKTGMGKSTLLENMASQDIKNGEGLCFIDPHGSAIDTLIEYIPEERLNDVIYFAPFDSEYPISFNVLETVPEDQRYLVVQGLMSTFDKIWPDTFSERMKYILSNTLLALLEYPGSTLLGVNRMYADKGYRQEVVKNISDPTVKTFWVDEFEKWDERFMREATAAIQNKIGQFTANPLVRNIIGQKNSSFDFREVMDKKKILLINLSKGRIGEQNSGLLGGMLITKIYLAAMSRADVSKSDMADLPPFFLFVDEFQNFANESFADILAEARKYKLNLTIAHQYVAQMEDEVRDAVFGNVGTTISFRVGPLDAELLEKVFVPTFTQEDIVNLGRFQMYLTLMIDGVGSKPFSAVSLSPLPKNPISFRDEVIDYSRNNFANKREVIEQYINEWYKKEFFTEKQRKEVEKKEDYLKSKFGQGYKPRGARPDDEYSGAFVPSEPKKSEFKKKDDLKKDRDVQKKVSKIVIPEEIKNKVVNGAPEKKEEISLKDMSLNLQKPNISVKDPRPESKSLLKDALSKVLKKEEPKEAVKVDQPKNIDNKNNFQKPEKEEESNNSQTSNNPNQKNNQTIKEVPEDILKRILE